MLVLLRSQRLKLNKKTGVEGVKMIICTIAKKMCEQKISLIMSNRYC
jgi:hypothetical protein